MVSEFDAETVEVVVGDDNGVIVFVTVDEILEPTESVLNRDSVVTAESEKLPVTDADAVIEFDADGDDESVLLADVHADDDELTVTDCVVTVVNDLKGEEDAKAVELKVTLGVLVTEVVPDEDRHSEAVAECEAVTDVNAVEVGVFKVDGEAVNEEVTLLLEVPDIEAVLLADPEKV